MEKHKIRGLTPETRADIMRAVYSAVDYWPHRFLGAREVTPLETIRSAFRLIRYHAGYTGSVHSGCFVLHARSGLYVDI